MTGRLFIHTCLSLFLFPLLLNGQRIHRLPFEGKVHFRSEAPLEIIEATSAQLNGILDTLAGTFAFTVEISSFEGFNNPVQREHFNENYMESRKFPQATFAGKIIEHPDWSKPGVESIRAKGKLKIHGVEQERILKCRLQIEPGKIIVHSEFTILLDEHKIRIPKIVNQKIAEEIEVTVTGVFTPIPRP